jgi:hypothetical protein
MSNLFGRKQGIDPQSLPPEFRPIAAKLPQLPPEQRKAMEALLNRAMDAGVSTLDEMDVFIGTQPTHLILLWANTLMSLL